MTAWVTEHLPLVAGAPDGIKKLRELILELAVRGKLIPQDPLDEPAAALLRKIGEQKHALFVAKKLRAAPTHVSKGRDDRIAVPTGWAAVRLADVVALVTDGDHQPPPKAETGVPFLVIGNLNTGSIRLEGCRFVPADYFDALDWGRKPTKGDLLYTVTGSFGIPIIVDVDAKFCVQRHVAILKTVTGAPVEFLKIVLASPAARAYAEHIATGIAQKTVPLTGLRQLPVLMPPLAEQHRIVAKVDELMALCDRLEADQADADAAHAQLVQALLASLTRATDAADFRTSWQRLSEHFHTLFTTEASIDALKQTVLQLAVMGKLVPQDTSEQSASVLLEEIARIQLTLIESEGLRTSAQVNVPSDERYLDLPTGWCFSRLGNLARFIDYRGRTPVKTHQGIPLITAKNVRRGFISREPAEFIAEADYEGWMTRGFPRVGDILFTTEAPLGNVAVIYLTERFALAQRVICFQLHILSTGPFLRIALMSGLVQEQIAEMATGMTATGVKSSKLKELPLPIPPLAEQHRIVAKVDELMTLCDQLKTQLAEARQQHAQLATVLVEQAVA